MLFQNMIAHLGIGTLEEFCIRANKEYTRLDRGRLTPEGVAKEYEFLKEHTSSWLDGYGARYSKLFLHELATHNLDNSCGLTPALFCRWLYNKIRPYSVFRIYDEICTLEWEDVPKDIPVHLRPTLYQTNPPLVRRSITKKASQFNRLPLKGFWHKHHTQAGFILTNILLQHNKPREQDRLAQFKKTAFPANPEEQDSWDAYLKLIAHETTVATYEERAREEVLTGEWIVYARHEGRNHYLTLATHSEQDENILQRIGLCRDEFPFLNDYPQFKRKL